MHPPPAGSSPAAAGQPGNATTTYIYFPQITAIYHVIKHWLGRLALPAITSVRAIEKLRGRARKCQQPRGSDMRAAGGGRPLALRNLRPAALLPHHQRLPLPKRAAHAVHDMHQTAAGGGLPAGSCHTVTGAYLRLLKQHEAAPAAAAPTPTPEQELQQLLEWQQLLDRTQQVAHDLLPQQASLVVYAVAKLQRPVPAALVHGLFQQLQAQRQLADLHAMALTNVLWAAAVLSATSANGRFSPPPAWCEGLHAATGGRLAEFNHHQLTSLLWSVGRLQQRPPATWVVGVLEALRPRLTALSPTQLTNTLWALAQIGYRPSKAWMRAWFRAAAAALPACSPDHLACLAGCLALLRVDPPYAAWAVAFRRRVQQQRRQLRPRHVATILCGLGKRRSSQPPFWVTLLLQQLLAPPPQQQHPQQCTASELAAAVWALPLLLAPTARDWTAQPANAALLRVAAAASLPLLPSCSLGQLVQLATGFARLGYFPGVHWLKTHENAVAARHLQLDEPNKARLRLALSKLWQDT